MGNYYAKCLAKVLKQPGEWQKFVIEFQLGKSDPTTKKTTPARFVRVELNGVLIHDNVEMERGARSPGPLYLQGNHGPVAYRNIKITPLGSGDKQEPALGETKPYPANPIDASFQEILKRCTGDHDSHVKQAAARGLLMLAGGQK